jgi:subtilisin
MISTRKLFAILFIIVLFAGCKKENNSSSSLPSNSDNCVSGQSLIVTGKSVNNTDIIEGQYIVSYNSSAVNARGMSQDRLDQLSSNTLQRHNISSKALQQSFAGEPGGFIAKLSKDELQNLKKDAAIQWIEPDRVVKLGICFTVAAPTLITWNVKRVGYGDGTGKKAWIIDSGIDFDHPDLTVDVSHSRSFISGQTSAADENGHGTHVAGIIGAKNNTFGILGVASGATLISLRVLDKNGDGTLSSIIAALGYVNTNAAAGDVVNMSLGIDTTSQTLIQQVKNTAARGIYISIAAGNDHVAAKDFSPANANGTNIYTVSATDSLDNFAGFSNYGNDVVDYAAPGVHILSTYPGNRYAYMSGTSMSAPHVAGLLLLKGNRLTISGYAKNDPDSAPDPIAHY